MVLIVVLLIVGAGIGVYFYYSRGRTAAKSPFTARIQSSVQFPLYYPNQLPQGYHIDTKTVTEPKASVVVFQLVGQDKESIYISEEARPSSFDLGGFYKQFTDFKSVTVSDGSIAAGYLQGGRTEIASRANGRVWVLATTSQQIPQSELIDMLRSLTVSY